MRRRSGAERLERREQGKGCREGGHGPGRAVVRRWGCEDTVSYVSDSLSHEAVFLEPWKTHSITK